MARQVAEDVVRARRFGPRMRVRVDLHGVSTFGRGDERTLIRWEWIERIDAGGGAGVEVTSAKARLVIPPGAFGLDPPALAARLEAARSIVDRPDVLEQLAGSR
jgi:hypothetical protein